MVGGCLNKDESQSGNDFFFLVTGSVGRILWFPRGGGGGGATDMVGTIETKN